MVDKFKEDVTVKKEYCSDCGCELGTYKIYIGEKPTAVCLPCFSKTRRVGKHD